MRRSWHSRIGKTPLRGSPPEGFSLPFFGKASRAEALGKLTRKIAGLFLTGFRNGFLRAAQKVGHAAAHRLARDLRFAAAPNRNWRSHGDFLRSWLTHAHLQPIRAESHGHSTIQTLVHTHRSVAQAGTHAGAIDPI